jgi:hypothetical protein
MGISNTNITENDLEMGVEPGKTKSGSESLAEAIVCVAVGLAILTVELIYQWYGNFSPEGRDPFGFGVMAIIAAVGVGFLAVGGIILFLSAITSPLLRSIGRMLVRAFLTFMLGAILGGGAVFYYLNYFGQ